MPIYQLGAMSSLVASAWLDKDLKYTLRFVSKSVFGFLATIALVVRTVEWTKGNLSFSNHGILTIKNETILDCQNICIRPNFTEANEFDCDNQELALDKRFAGQSSPIFLTISIRLRGNDISLGSVCCLIFCSTVQCSAAQYDV